MKAEDITGSILIELGKIEILVPSTEGSLLSRITLAKEYANQYLKDNSRNLKQLLEELEQIMQDIHDIDERAEELVRRKILTRTQLAAIQESGGELMDLKHKLIVSRTYESIREIDLTLSRLLAKAKKNYLSVSAQIRSFNTKLNRAVAYIQLYATKGNTSKLKEDAFMKNITPLFLHLSEEIKVILGGVLDDKLNSQIRTSWNNLTTSLVDNLNLIRKGQVAAVTETAKKQTLYIPRLH